MPLSRVWLVVSTPSRVVYDSTVFVLCDESTNHVVQPDSSVQYLGVYTSCPRVLFIAWSPDVLMVVWIRSYWSKIEYVYSSCRVPYFRWWYGLMLVSRANHWNLHAVELNGSLSFEHCSIIWNRTRGLIICSASFSFGSTQRKYHNLHSFKITQFSHENRVTIWQKTTSSRTEN